MATVQELTEAMRAELRRSPAGTGSMTFDFGADGVIRLDGGTADNRDLPSDCRLTAPKDAFDEMLAGRLDPREAVMAGTFEIDGDLGILMALQPQVRAAWGYAAT